MARTDGPLRAMGHELHFGYRRLRRLFERPRLVRSLLEAAALGAGGVPSDAGSALVTGPMRSLAERGRRGATP